MAWFGSVLFPMSLSFFSLLDVLIPLLALCRFVTITFTFRLSIISSFFHLFFLVTFNLSLVILVKVDPSLQANRFTFRTSFFI